MVRRTPPKLRLVGVENEDDGPLSLSLMFDDDNSRDLPLSSVFAIVGPLRRDRESSAVLKGHFWAAGVDVNADERQICSRMKLQAAIIIIKLMTT